MSREMVLLWEFQVDGKTYYPISITKPSKKEGFIDAPPDGALKYKIADGIKEIMEIEVKINIKTDLAAFTEMNALVDGQELHDISVIARDRTQMAVMEYLLTDCEILMGEAEIADRESVTGEIANYIFLPQDVDLI
ncbi:MAG: hypothetical protein KOO69_02500 [Victivallales bacterium]|nr:hypothetical protein [Victivallales bacterium]